MAPKNRRRLVQEDRWRAIPLACHVSGPVAKLSDIPSTVECGQLALLWQVIVTGPIQIRD
ncbi:MAG: hypothetical protein AAF268_06735 [Cyanobacteria bacterium P01_A01_bin.3]